MSDGPSLRRAVVALQHRDFALFYTALLVAALGSQIQSTAILIQVYEITGSAVHLGLTGLARAIPTILFSLMGGVIADRVDRRRFVIITQVLPSLTAGILAVLTLTGQIEIRHMYVIIFVNGCVSAMSSPARSAIVPGLVPREHLMNAIALNSTVWQASNIIGPAIAGLTIGAVGLTATYVLNGTLHVVSVGALLAMHFGAVELRRRAPAWNSLVEGVAFVRKETIILALLATDMAAMLFGSYRVLLPIFAERLELGPQGLGLLFSAPGVGSLIGAAIIMSLGDFRYKGLWVVAAILAYCGSLVLLAMAPWFWLALLAAALTGVTDSFQATPRNGVIQRVTPDGLRGRVSSFQHMLVNGMPSLGQALAGGAAALLTAPVSVTAGAAICAAAVLAILGARRELRAADLGSAPSQRAAPVATASEAR